MSQSVTQRDKMLKMRARLAQALQEINEAMAPSLWALYDAGLIDDPPQIAPPKTPTTNLQTKPAGRKRDQTYDEAYDMICQGTPDTEVFIWYCGKMGWSKPGKHERDTFKAAMKRRRKGT